jgi:hypothetical protein
MYLELAENGGYGGLPETALAQGERESPYLFVPGGMIPGIAQDSYVNEAQFDDLDPYAWNQVMELLEPYQPNNLSLWPFSTKKGRSRRTQRREVRQANKIAKIETRAAAGGGIGGIVAKIGGIFAPKDTMPMDTMPMVAPGAVAAPGAKPPPKEKTAIQKYWPYAAGAVGVGLLVFLLAKKKKK